jgi:hypothetical protein
MARPPEFDPLRSQTEPFDEETLELLRLELTSTLGRLNRLCNTLMNRPKGIPEAVLVSIGIIKICVQDIEWYSKYKSSNRDQTELLELAGDLARVHCEDTDDLGDTARRLQAILPDAAKA